MKIVNAAKKLYTEVTSHWSKPAKGNFVSYKELLNLSVGGMGQQLILMLSGYMGLTVANTLIASVIGITPIHLQVMATIMSILSIFFTIIRSKIVDNTRGRFGRFRPYIAIMGIPLAILGGVFVFLPFQTMTYTSKLIVCFLFVMAFSAISPFYTDSYNNLISVITPNATERTKVYAINTILFSIAPTITNNMLTPLLAGLFEGTYTNINMYRWVIFPMALVGVGLNFFAAFGCKERVVESVTYVPKVRLFKGALEIFKNKYFWILNLAAIIGFTEGAFGVLLSWLFIYGTQNMVFYSLSLTILSTAATIGMVSAPFIMRKIGNKKTLLLHNFLNIGFVLGMMLSYNVSYLFFIFYYLNTVINSLALIYNPELYSEMKDYQQYISKKRMDNTFAIAGLFLSPISMATAFFIPFVQESYGLSTNLNILYDPTVRNPLFYIICALSVAGAVLNLIPYFFFNMSVEKHKWIVCCMRYRIVISDYLKGAVTDDQRKEIVEIMQEYESLNQTGLLDERGAKKSFVLKKKQLGKTLLPLIKATLCKAEQKEQLKAERAVLKEQKRALKKEWESAKRHNRLFKESEVFAKELKRFENEKELDKLAFAKEVVAVEKGEYSKMSEEQALELANKSLNEREKTRFLRMTKKVKKAYPNGVEDGIVEQLNEAIAMPHANRIERIDRIKAIKAAENKLFKQSKVFEFYDKMLDMVAESRSAEIYAKIFEENKQLEELEKQQAEEQEVAYEEA